MLVAVVFGVYHRLERVFLEVIAGVCCFKEIWCYSILSQTLTVEPVEINYRNFSLLFGVKNLRQGQVGKLFQVLHHQGKEYLDSLQLSVAMDQSFEAAQKLD